MKGKIKLPLFLFLSTVILCTFPSPLFAKDKEPRVEIVEKLGEKIPLNLEFMDETGKKVSLSKIINKPTILLFVYYQCPGICTPLLNGLKDVLEIMKGEPGTDFDVVCVSFNPNDTYETAAQKKENYLSLMQRKISPNGWRFLTGAKENITKLTESIGFYYMKTDDGNFRHTGALYAISPKGKICRYIYGGKKSQFLPFTLSMALNEAAAGKTGPTIAKLLLYCFSYDPESQKFVLNVTRIGGAIILFFLAIFVIFVVLKPRKKIEETEKGN